MLGNRVFRIALAVSITAHTALLAPWANLDSLRKRHNPSKEVQIEVNYLEIKIKPKPRIQEKMVARVSTEGKDTKDTLKRKAKVQPKPKYEKPVLTTAKEVIEFESPTERIQFETVQQKNAYMGYYNIIREKIKKTLLKMYKSRFDEGEIYLVFTLNSTGILGEIEILGKRSTDSRRLKDIAAKALKKSSPFPPFPEELDNPQINFNVVISFRK